MAAASTGQWFHKNIGRMETEKPCRQCIGNRTAVTTTEVETGSYKIAPVPYNQC